MPSKEEKAKLIVQAEKATDWIIEDNDPRLKVLMSLEDAEFNSLYEWAGKAMSAMRWNTMTLRCWK